MNTEKQWFENDTFWETWQPWLFAQPRIEHAAQEVDWVLGLLQTAPGARILDLGCGVGRHSLELARRGFKVTGVDRMERYLEQAREKAAQEKLDVEFVQSDMRDFRRPNTFDAVINLFTTFGYFRDPNDDRAVVKNVCDSLKPRGVFLLDTQGKETLAKIFQKHMWNEYGGMIVLNEMTVSQNWSWMQARWIMLRGSERIENTVEHRLYAGSEMAALFMGGGFGKADIYGDAEGHPYDETARRLVAVGRK
ncbi:MAG: class I SAM-dependent methyltransferase [Dehalococcoidales bacterium]